MPFEIGHPGRRSFLTGLAGVAVAGVSEVLLPPAEARLASDGTWALLSDMHIASHPGVSHRGCCMAGNAERVVSEILSRDAGTAGVIVNGDCAHLHGRFDDYRNFAGLIEPLVRERREVHLLMGNHDDRGVFQSACAEAFPDRGGMEGRRTAIIRSEHLNWFLLDSLEEGSWIAGRLGREQIDWLASSLDLHPDKPAVIMAHHHLRVPDAKGRVYKPMAALRDSSELYEVMASRRQVMAFVHGHTHRWEIGRTREGIHLVNLPSSAYVFEPGQPGGWVEAVPRPNGLDLTLRSIDPRHPGHGERHRLEWR